MTEQEQIAAAVKFSADWKERGNEISDTQHFWTELFHDVFGVEKPFNIIKFEQPVDLDGTTHYMDATIPSTHVLIEQKSYGTDLTRATRQSDGTMLTPFEQAGRYAEELPYSERPRWIVTCNFAEFYIYDIAPTLDHNEFSPVIIKLETLRYDYKYLNFLVDPDDDNVKPEVKLSKQAIGTMQQIYNLFKTYYNKHNAAAQRDSLCKLCVRFVFCFYAEKSYIFNNNQFHDYLNFLKRKNINNALQNLFAILNQPAELRGEVDAELNSFPYVNGGLFSEAIFIPDTDNDFATQLNSILAAERINNEFKELNWHLISPPIFGAMFESVINSDDRRAGGMHYTSVENIHKVIDPLFMDELHAEFQSARRKHKSNRVDALQKLHDKLSSLTFLDPACGSGNFLTETYLSLRRLENDILRELMRYDCDLPPDPIKVSIHQFYGIEINDFAVAVAQVALWIAENQMLQDTEMIVGKNLNALPLKNYANIVRTNALRVDWSDIVPRDKLSYIIGNPPFVGRRFRDKEQVSDIAQFFTYKDIDYVACWYKKASEFISDTKIRCAFVSTNSITQGEQIAPLWKDLNVHIDFAHRTFKWLSESDNMAAVHCVIVGFSRCKSRKPKIIFDGDKRIIAKNINAYLYDAPDVFIEHRTKPICNVPEMHNGNVEAGGGHLIITENEYEDFIRQEPAAQKYIRKLIDAEDFINGGRRYCLWLVGYSVEEIASMPLVKERVDACRKYRSGNSYKSLADRPHLFRDLRDPKSFIILPVVSSERRRYMPIDYGTPEVIVTNALQTIPDATIYHFGVLTSSIHMAWLRTVCGRLEMRYRYSKNIVYNNFVWCEPSPAQRLAIESSAQNILDVRSRYEGWSLAQLYNEATMPSDLRAAHAANDAAVMAAYGFDVGMSEAEIVAELMSMYQAKAK